MFIHKQSSDTLANVYIARFKLQMAYRRVVYLSYNKQSIIAAMTESADTVYPVL